MQGPGLALAAKHTVVCCIVFYSVNYMYTLIDWWMHKAYKFHGTLFKNILQAFCA